MSMFDRIFADVRKDLPSVPDAVVRQELYRVLDDFTQTTNIFQSEVTVPILKDVTSYNINSLFPEGEGKPNRLLWAYDANSPVKNWPMSGIMMRVPGILTLYRAPGNDATWQVIIAKRTAEPLSSDKYPNIDEWIVDKYQDCLGRGTLARLQFQPQKPWSNPMQAQVNQRAYISGRSLARANDGHANVYNAQNWQFPQGWASVQRKSWS